MIKCSRRSGHDIPSAVQSPANQRTHDLSAGLRRAPGTGSADLPAVLLLSLPDNPDGLADLIREVWRGSAVVSVHRFKYVLQSTDAGKDEHFFRERLAEVAGIGALYELFLNIRTFSLWVEILAGSLIFIYSSVQPPS